MERAQPSNRRSDIEASRSATDAFPKKRSSSTFYAGLACGCIVSYVFLASVLLVSSNRNTLSITTGSTLTHLSDVRLEPTQWGGEDSVNKLTFNSTPATKLHTASIVEQAPAENTKTITIDVPATKLPAATIVEKAPAENTKAITIGVTAAPASTPKQEVVALPPKTPNTTTVDVALPEPSVSSTWYQYQPGERPFTAVEKEVFDKLAYWKRRKLSRPLTDTFPSNADKFVTMELDLGGFNNVRMSFEGVISAAMILGRTFVVPYACEWYLINWGQIARDDSKSGVGGTSKISDFFDLEDLGRVIPIISTEEFMARHRANTTKNGIVIPDTITEKALQTDKRCASPFGVFLRLPQKGLEQAGSALNPIRNAVSWRSKQAVNQAGAQPSQHFLMGRHNTELLPEQLNSTVLHFAMDYEKDHRYMGQIAGMWVMENKEWSRELFRALRDGLHYKAEVYAVAARVVARLGFEGYAAMHIRRNELQYKQVFKSAEQSLIGAGEVIRPGEAIYLATDEVQQGFFDVFEQRGHKVYRFEDFFTDKGGGVLNGVPGARDSKIIGLVEQVICACGRVFIGTELSTFSGHIPRLRGHVGVQNKHVYYHTRGPYKADSKGERGTVDGNYFIEYEEMYNVD